MDLPVLQPSVSGSDCTARGGYPRRTAYTDLGQSILRVPTVLLRIADHAAHPTTPPGSGTDRCNAATLS